MVKVLIADKLAKEGLEVLVDAGYEVINQPGRSQEEIIADPQISDYDAIIIRSATNVRQPILDAATNLKAIGRAGSGVNNIDIDYATEKGVAVFNTPGGNATAVMRLGVQHILNSISPFYDAVQSMKEGKWSKSELMGQEVNGQTVGIVGLGNIGRGMATIMGTLGAKVIGYDPNVTSEKAKEFGTEWVELDDLFAKSDYITLHVPSNPKTNDMINKDSLAKMKDGVKIYNLARGEIITEEDLLEALNSGKVSHAGLDAYQKEKDLIQSAKSGPSDEIKNHPLISHENVSPTPHIGAATKEAQVNVAVAVTHQVADYLTRGDVRNSVNLNIEEDAAPYVKLARNLGKLASSLSDGSLKPKVEVTYSGKLAEIEEKIARPQISNCILEGILSAHNPNVNLVNVSQYIEDSGLKVIPTTRATDDDYLGVKFDTSEGPMEVRGNLNEEGTPRTLYVQGVKNRFEPLGNITFIEYKDSMGVDGITGMHFAKAGLNVRNKNVLPPIDKNGVMVSQAVIRTDKPVDYKVLSELEDTLKTGMPEFSIPPAEVYTLKSINFD